MTDEPMTNDQLMPNPVAATPALSNVQAAFIRNVHHELRTPLGVVHGYTQLLNLGALGDLNPDQQHVLLIMDRRLNDLQTIVERIEVLMTTAGQLSPAIQLAPLELMTPIVNQQQAAADQAKLKLAFEAEADLPLVYGDPKALAVALECLIENAVRFTPAGGQVTLRLWAAPGWVNFEISDTGIGIEPEKLTQVLDGFCQADDGDSRRYNGLGLGLAVVKAVVNRHAGQLSVASVPGLGSQFVLQLPSVMTRVNPMHPTSDLASHKPKPRRILLVDDEINQVSILRAGLARLPDCEIAIATSGRQALELFAQKPFDLMITDYRMPEMDGLALAALVRDQYPTTHIIMLTAFGSEALRETADASPAQLVLEKPVDIKHIRSAALNALNKAD